MHVRVGKARHVMSCDLATRHEQMVLQIVKCEEVDSEAGTRKIQPVFIVYFSEKATDDAG